METETIDRLFLELSQVTKATTANELELQGKVESLLRAVKPFANLLSDSTGRIPYERLAMSDWHLLAVTYAAVRD